MTETSMGTVDKASLSAMLHAVAMDESRERIAVSDLLAVSGDRALAALLFVFAVPIVLPVPPGTLAVVVSGVVFALIKATVYFTVEALR